MITFRQYKAEEIREQLRLFRNGPKQRIPDNLVNINFKVLKDAIYCLQIPKDKPEQIEDWRLLAIDDKIAFNGLSESSREIIKAGVIYIETVEKFIKMRVGNGDTNFPDRLTELFQAVYAEYYCNSMRGDDLFDLMLMELENAIPKLHARKAVYAIFSYLFEKCFIFEK